MIRLASCQKLFISHLQFQDEMACSVTVNQNIWYQGIWSERLVQEHLVRYIHNFQCYLFVWHIPATL